MSDSFLLKVSSGDETFVGGGCRRFDGEGVGSLATFAANSIALVNIWIDSCVSRYVQMTCYSTWLENSKQGCLKAKNVSLGITIQERTTSSKSVSSYSSSGLPLSKQTSTRSSS